MLALSGAIPSVEGNVSAYLLSKPRMLREVCHSTGRDEAGRRCGRCNVRIFCEGQARRAGEFGAPEPVAIVVE